MYYFASDVHLGSGTRSAARDTERRFVSWLDMVSRDARGIFLLGDIFDFWFEYKRVVPRGFVRTLSRLSSLTERGVRVVLITGNHDMWMRDYLQCECGVEVYDKPQTVEIAGRRMFLAHGDNMKIEGRPMLRMMNAVFRSRTARFLFRWLVHPDLALKFGKWWSGRSRKSHGYSPEESILDPLTDYAADLGRREGVDCAVFGHFHLAADRRRDDTRILFLSDWSGAAAYAVMTDDGELTLKYYTER